MTRGEKKALKFFKCIFVVLLIFAVAVAGVYGAYRLFPLRYTEIIRSEADAQGVDRYLVTALIKAESNFKANAFSSAEAKGLMQLTDETAAFCAEKLGIELGENDIYSPEINIKLGVCYLARVLELFEGNEELAIASYNAGEGRVREWLNDPMYSTDGVSLDTIPYDETRRHVEKIAVYEKIYKVLYPNL